MTQAGDPDHQQAEPEQGSKDYPRRNGWYDHGLHSPGVLI